MALMTLKMDSKNENIFSMTDVYPHNKLPSTYKRSVNIPFAPLVEIVKLFASVPLHISPTGWQFSVFSWEFVGCVLIYLAIVPIYWVVVRDVYPLYGHTISRIFCPLTYQNIDLRTGYLRAIATPQIEELYPDILAYLFIAPAEDATEHFNQQIYYELFATLMVPYIITPLTTWLDAPRTAAYLNRCTEFLDTYETTARKRLRFSLKSNYLVAFTTVGIVCQNVAVQVVPPYLAFWKTPACTINLVALCTYLSYWVCLTDCLSQAGEAIAKDLKLELQAEYCDAKKIVRFKQLWLELSQLTTDASSHFYRTATVPVLLTFFLITISVYGFFASLREPVYLVFYVFCVFFNTMPLYLICNNSYVTMAKVRDPTMNTLIVVRRSRVNASCWQAVRSFLETIYESPPVISLGGYAAIDRKFLHAAGTTITTYLVVIFQFRMGLQTNEKKPADGFDLYALVSPESFNSSSI